MLMVSDVAEYLIHVLVHYGDLPCVLEHHSATKDNILLDPLEDLPILTIYKRGEQHSETCVLFTNRQVEDTEDED